MGTRVQGIYAAVLVNFSELSYDGKDSFLPGISTG
jgi:hypothetical protein